VRAFRSIESPLRDEHETNEPFTIPREAIDLARRRSAITAYKEENGIDGQIPNGRSTGRGHSRGRLIDRELIKRTRRNDEEASRSPRSIRPVSRIGGAPLLRDGEKGEIIRHSSGDRESRKDERWPGINTGLFPFPPPPSASLLPGVNKSRCLCPVPLSSVGQFNFGKRVTREQKRGERGREAWRREAFRIGDACWKRLHRED